MPRLIVKIGGATKTVPLGEDAVTIGRTPENSLHLDNEGVSRKHAQILFVGRGWEVVDLGSRNGTKVNGKKVPRAMLKPGDVIGVGPAEVVFEEEGAAAASGGGATGLEVEELDLGAATGGGGGGGGRSSANAPTAAIQIGGGGVPAGPAGECLLRILAGEKQGTEIPLKSARTTFGRRPSNTVSFQDSSVSGVHCEVTREPNGYVLRDLGSTNGTLVDGEPVVETMLRHNSRVRIGAQRLVFVDPTVADIESTLAAGDEAGEWGLMRGEVDVEGSRRRGGSGGLVAAGLVLAIAGGGGWYVWRTAPRHVEVAAVKDNRVPDPSFEGGVVLWFPPGEEESAAARIAGTSEAPRGASGVSCLEVVPQGDPGAAPALVEFRGGGEGGDASVTPDAPYEVSVRVGSGTGAAVVSWISSSRPGLLREVSTPPVEGGASWPASKAVVTAPAHATGARILLAAFGGTASFDDVVFRRADGAGAPALSAPDLRVRIDASGGFEAVRGGEVLLTQGGLAPSVETSQAELLGASLDGEPSLAGNALTASGTLRGGSAFEVRAEAVAEGVTLACAPKSGAGAFTFNCPAGLQRGSVTLVLEHAGSVVPEGEAFRLEGVRKVIVGTAEGPQPFVLSALPGSPGFTFSSRRTARGLRVSLAPPEKAPEGVDVVTVLLSVDLSRENQAGEEGLRGARDMRAAGNLGKAAEAFDGVAVAYHYLPSFREPAAKARGEILQDGAARLKGASETARSAKRFRDSVQLEVARESAGRLAREFEGHEIGARAKELAEAAQRDLDEVRSKVVESRVEGLYQRAKDLEKDAQTALALSLYEEILRIAPEGNEFRDAAATQVEVLRKDLENRQKSLFGVPKAP